MLYVDDVAGSKCFGPLPLWSISSACLHVRCAQPNDYHWQGETVPKRVNAVNMTKSKLTCVIIIIVIVTIPLLVCGAWAISVERSASAREAAEGRAQPLLQATRANLPLVTGDVVLDNASGVGIGGTMACYSYVNIELHGTNALELGEVLDFYSTTLPRIGWVPSESFNIYGRAFSKDGNLQLSVYPSRQYYWYYLCPFGPQTETCRPPIVPPDKPTLDAMMASYKTVFAMELATFPPPDVACAGH